MEKQATLLYLPSDANKSPVAFGEQGKRELEFFICNALNSTEKPELRESLRRIVAAWQASGPNLEKMMYDNLDLFQRVAVACRAHWTPQNDGRAILMLMPDYMEGQEQKMRRGDDGVLQPTPEAEALVLFHFLTLNREWDKLAGHCARCGNYYVKKRTSQQVYCSRRCGNAATAVVRTRAKLDAEHKKKMLRAKALIREWNKLKGRSRLVWKEWLRKQEPSITDKFVTRRVNTGELPEPKAGRKP
jgi:hypothetical protein